MDLTIFSRLGNLIGSPKKVEEFFNKENTGEKTIQEVGTLLAVIIAVNIISSAIGLIVTKNADLGAIIIAQIALVVIFIISFFVGAFGIHAISKFIFRNDGKFLNLTYLLAIMAILNAFLNLLLMPVVLIDSTKAIAPIISVAILGYKLYLDFFAIKSTYKITNIESAKVFLTNIIIWTVLLVGGSLLIFSFASQISGTSGAITSGMQY